MTVEPVRQSVSVRQAPAEAAKFWAWSAGELAIAGLIGRLLYHPPSA